MSGSKERRSGKERRVDLSSGPPPGWKERRRAVERRLPQVDELVISAAEWEAYFVRPKAKRQADRSQDGLDLCGETAGSGITGA